MGYETYTSRTYLIKLDISYNQMNEYNAFYVCLFNTLFRIY